MSALLPIDKTYAIRSSNLRNRFSAASTENAPAATTVSTITSVSKNDNAFFILVSPESIIIL